MSEIAVPESISEIASRILGRSLNASDGVPARQIKEVEDRLGLTLPMSLRNFYRHVGSNPLFMTAFEQVIPIEDLAPEDGLLVFMEENQGAVSWALRFVDSHEEHPMVFQVDPVNCAEIHRELDIDAFLNLMLYYQAAQGGYTHVGWLYEWTDTLREIEQGWEKVAEYNGLQLWFDDGKIIFRLGDTNDDFLTASTRTSEGLAKLVEKYGFVADE